MNREAAQFDSEKIIEKAYLIAQELSGYEGPIGAHTSYGTDLGFVDTDKLNLVMEFEDEFGVKLGNPSADDLSSPAATVEYLLRELKSQQKKN